MDHNRTRALTEQQAQPLRACPLVDKRHICLEELFVETNELRKAGLKVTLPRMKILDILGAAQPRRPRDLRAILVRGRTVGAVSPDFLTRRTRRTLRLNLVGRKKAQVARRINARQP